MITNCPHQVLILFLLIYIYCYNVCLKTSLIPPRLLLKCLYQARKMSGYVFDGYWYRLCLLRFLDWILKFSDSVVFFFSSVYQHWIINIYIYVSESKFNIHNSTSFQGIFLTVSFFYNSHDSGHCYLLIWTIPFFCVNLTHSLI